MLQSASLGDGADLQQRMATWVLAVPRAPVMASVTSMNDFIADLAAAIDCGRAFFAMVVLLEGATASRDC